MKHLFFLSIFFSSINLFTFAQISRPIGTNLTGIVDYSTEFVFVDVFKQSREWIAHEISSGSPWSSGVHIPLNSQGYPLEIPYHDGINPPQGIRTLLFFGDLAGIYPGGNYRFMASGTGQISFSGALNGTYNCPIDTILNVNNTGGIILEIDVSQASDPIHDIHFVMPGHHTTFLQEPFHPELISFIEDFQVLRFMDWQSTNNSKTETWSDRNPLNYYTQTVENGVAPEILIDFCNRKQKNQ
jgi:hypothetical protein